MNEHDRFEVAFAKLRQEKGLADDGTLQAAFDLMNSWIGLYRLEPVQVRARSLLCFFCFRDHTHRTSIARTR